jgi:HPt (histidine-containing phosphotransfer) domain-containing protein
MAFMTRENYKEMEKGSIALKPAAQPLPARDEAAALAATGGDAELANELFATLSATLSQEVREIKASFAAEDWPGVLQSAHRLRGATSYCGVPALDSALQALEQAAKAGDSAEIRRWLQAVPLAAERLSAL